MKSVDLPTSIEVEFDEVGRPRVRAFSLAGKRLTVTSVGRSWLEDDGRHVLVTVSGERIFELLLRRSDLNWRIVGSPSEAHLV